VFEIELTVIGCSSGMPSGDQSTSSYLLEAGGSKYLLDCGDGTASACSRLGIDVNSINSIYISHMHADHCMGLPLLVQMMYLQKRTEPLKIYLPREAEDGFKRLFYMTYLFFEKFSFEIQFIAIEEGVDYKDDNILIEFHPNSHLHGNKDYIMQRTIPNRMQCFSMIVRSGDSKLVYSADIGSIEDIVSIIDDTDLLITEGMHIDLDDLPYLLIKTNVRQTLLTHLPADLDLALTKMDFEKSGYSNFMFAKEGLNLLI
jgi:ribonuclease BN (tRNA processing enzyme)